MTYNKNREPLRISIAAQRLGMHSTTLRRKIRLGKINTVEIKGEKRIPWDEMKRQALEKGGIVALYARSTRTTAPDLEKQRQQLLEWAKVNRPNADVRVFKDYVGKSGTRRSKILRLHVMAETGKLAEIVVTNPDRLSILNFELLERTFAGFNVTVTCLDEAVSNAFHRDLFLEMIEIIESVADSIPDKSVTRSTLDSLVKHVKGISKK